jgi:hypothetical protein
LIVPLKGSVGERISELYHAEREGRSSVGHRSRAQKIAIAFASKRRDAKKRRRK